MAVKLSDQRLKEMEAEMNRFEEEISSQKAAAAAAERRKAMSAALLPPPPPPPVGMKSSTAPLCPPPPPPPSLGATFVPPQLRHRMPPPPPPPRFANFPGGAMPPRPPPSAFGPMPPPGFVSGPVGPFPPLGGGFYPGRGPTPPTMAPPSKVIYSAAPTKNPITPLPTGGGGATLPTAEGTHAVADHKGSKRKRKGGGGQGGGNESQKKQEPLPPPIKKIEIVPGIELNVPVAEIEAERGVANVMPPGGGAEGAEGGTKKEKKEKKKKFLRQAAGQTWEDPSLAEWDPDDFRIFCGDLGNEVTDDALTRAFNRYPSFVKARVIRDKRSSKSRGYGFVSFKDPADFVKAMREMNGKYVGNRPIKLRKSNWKDRQADIVKKKDKEKKRLGFR